MSFSFSSLVSVDNYHLLCSLFLIFKPNFDYCFKSTVHLRLRPMDQNNPRTLFPSTSAVTYWQIELQTGPIDGMSNLYACIFIEKPSPNQKSERLCVCVGCINFAYFYDFSIGFWNCSKNVVFLFFN